MAPSGGAKMDDRGFLRAKRAVHGPLLRARQVAGQAGKKVAVALCPVGNEAVARPRLYQTIRVQTNQYVTELVAGDKKRRVIHAGYVEFGTSNMKPQPFMNPAVAVMKTVFVREARKGVRGALR